MVVKVKNTEVDAYIFAKESLKQVDWDIRNPAKVTGGQVYTQNQCLSEPEIKKWLDKKHPEYIVKVTETILWVIECKKTEIFLPITDNRQLDEEYMKTFIGNTPFWDLMESYIKSLPNTETISQLKTTFGTAT